MATPTTGDDILDGTSGNDTIDGLAGNDTITSFGGKDVLSGGAGDDIVVLNAPITSGSYFDGGAGNDTLRILSGAVSSYPFGNFALLLANAVTNFETIELASQAGEVVEALTTISQIAGVTSVKGGAGVDVFVVVPSGSAGIYNLQALDLANWTDGTDFFLFTADGNGGDYTLNVGMHNGIVSVGGGSGNDTLNGSNGAEFFTGGLGNDVINAFGGNDTLNGGDGNDTLNGGLGNDSIDGGNGIDTASYADAPGAVTVDLSLSAPQNTGSAGTDTIVNVENLTGSAFDDTLTGTTGNNTIIGGDGNDRIVSGGGLDILQGNGGGDTFVFSASPVAGSQISGGAGTDTLELHNQPGVVPNPNLFDSSGAALTILDFTSSTVDSIDRIAFASDPGTTLTAQFLYGGALPNQVGAGLSPTAELVGGDGTDAVLLVPGVFPGAPQTINVPNFTYTNWQTPARANQQGDRVIVFAYGGGDVTINGSAHPGVQMLLGNTGNDTINGSSGMDLIGGGGGVDQLRGGGGNDTLLAYNTVQNNASGVPQAESTETFAGTLFDGGAEFDFLDVGGTVNFQGTVTNIEGLYLHPSYTSTLPNSGSQKPTVMTVSGATWNQMPGNLEIDGTGKVIVGLAAGNTFNGSAYTFDSGSNVQFTINGTPVNDIITGTVNADRIVSGGGRDNVHAGQGDDTVAIDVGIGFGSTIDGGGGTDTLELHNAAGQPVTTGNQFPSGLPSTTYNALASTVSSIERVDFQSTAGNYLSLFLGFGGPAQFTSQVGPAGLSDTATLLGGAGYDSLVLISGYTAANTPGGFNFTVPLFNYTGWSTPARAYLPGDRVIVINSGDANGTIAGSAHSAGSQHIAAGSGNVTLNGSNDMDYLTGGGSGSHLNGNGGNDTLVLQNLISISQNPQTSAITVLPETTNTGLGVSYDGGDGFDFLMLGGNVDFQGTVFNMEGLYLAPSYTNTIQPGVTNTTSQNPTIVTVTGATWSQLPGNLEIDGVGSVIVNLAPGNSFDGSGYAFDAGSNVQFTINGTSGNDTITGTSNADRIVTGDGADVVHALGGDDFVDGGAGNDVLDGGDGNDLVLGRDGNDILSGGDGQDEVYGEGGDDTFIGNLSGLDYNDGGAGFNTLDYSQAGVGLTFRSQDPESISVYTPQAQVLRAKNMSSIIGSANNDVLDFENYGVSIVAKGGAGADGFTGTAFADTFSGDAGNDTIDGRAGIDIAIYGGTRATYALSRNGDGSVTITDTRPGSPDGTDTLVNVENLRFADGDISLAAALNHAPQIVPQYSSGTIASGIPGAVYAANGDFNGDGNADFVVVDGFAVSEARVFTNLGNGTFSQGAPMGDGPGGARTVFVKDLNGDGKLDLIYANSNNTTVGVALGNGNGTFAGVATYSSGPTGPGPGYLAFGDVNGDGKVDIVTSGASSAALLLGNGDGSFGAPSLLAGTVGNVNTIALADFNGDNKLDLAIADHNAANLSILTGDGLGGFQSFATYNLGGGALAVGDFNEDGVKDIAWSTGGQVIIMRGAGDGTFTQTYVLPKASGLLDEVITDVDGDGHLDIVTTNYSTATLSVFLGRGDGSFQSQSVYTTLQGPTTTAIGDFDGDRDTDIVVTNADVSTVTLLRQQSSGIASEDGSLIDGQLVATDQDPGDQLTYSLNAPIAGLVLNPDGSWEFDPSDAAYQGLAEGAEQTLVARYTVTDTFGASVSSVFRIVVSGVNDAPVAANASANGSEDQPVTGQFAATDVDSFALSFHVIDGPLHGQLALGATGNFTYTPDADWFGTDSFTFAANDGSLDSLPAAISLSVAPVNDPPVAANGTASGNEDSLISGTLAASDIEGDPLTYALVAGPAHGQVTVNPGGSFDYTPDANYFGADSFTFKANDGQADSAPGTVSITVDPVDNDPAVIGGQLTGAITEKAVPGGANGQTAGLLTVSDPDGPTSFVPAILPGTYGSLTLLDGGSWTYTLADDDPFVDALAGGAVVTDSFTVTTLDGTTASIVVTVTGANDAAVIGGATSGSVTESSLAGGSSQVTGTLTISDIDSPAQFAAATVAGLYGSLTLSAAGVWTYVLDNANPLIDGLSNGQSLTETIAIQAADGTAKSIVVTINGANDVRSGTGGDDTLTGTSGNDTLNGNGGNDTLIGGLGDDILNGGAGADTASYAGLAAGVTVTLAIATPQNTGGGGIDSLNSIENLTGTAFNDVLTGSAGANVLSGGSGNDVLDGGAGADTLDGGAGTDTASYQSAAAGVTVTLAIQGAPQNTGAGNDTLISIENLTGSAFADTLTGDGGDNVIDGSGGNDTLEGGAGNDTLIGGAGIDTASYATAAAGVAASLLSNNASGGAGNDTLSGIENLTGSTFADVLTGDGGANVINGGAGNDIIEGGAGNDTLDGGVGIDTASYATAAGGVTVSLALAGAQNTGGAGADTLSNFENLTGSAFADSLTGSTTANTITGGDGGDTINAGGGNDTVFGEGGNDTIDGGAGDDALDGGAGIDTLSYASAAAAVTVSLALAAAQNTGGGGIDTVTGFENLTGSGSNDVLTGDGQDNVILGGAGNDTIEGGLGNDSLDGGAGTGDTASYAGALAGVSVSLAVAGAQNTVSAGNDTLTGFENLTGSAFNDILTGDSGANTLNGGNGNDVLDGGAGADTLNGGAGIDTASYASAASGVTVSLAVTAAQATGGAGSDTLSAIENLTGSAFADTLTGSAAANVIVGGDGADRITGGGAADQLTGGLGIDTFVYTATGDSIAAAQDIIVDFEGGGVPGGDILDFSAIDAIVGGRDNAFTFIGTGAFGNVAGQLRYDITSNPGFTLVQGDVNGDGVADLQLMLQWTDLAHPISLTPQDFIA